jgi:hypothetical protein
MTITVAHLAETDLAEYGQFLERSADSLLYHQPEYISTIRAIARPCSLHLIGVRRNGKLVASLALIEKTAGDITIVNSLPYFGSHGDIVIADDEDQHEVSRAIAHFLKQDSAFQAAAAVNIVAHPLRSWIETVAADLSLTAWDERIGQISSLPDAREADAALAAILAGCSQKTRNLVRKGLRQGFTITISDDPEDWDVMIHHHRTGMERIGGRAKTTAEFDAIRAGIPPGRMRQLFIARKDGEFAGGLLNLYYRDWVEYFTPVAVEKFRSDQVLSALICHAMVSACTAGLRHWNWGGTWTSQAGVYHFKKGWGAIDHRYRYFGVVRNERVCAAAPSALTQALPFFYARPFSPAN